MLDGQVAESLLQDYSLSFQLAIDDSTEQNSTMVLQYIFIPTFYS